MLKNIRLPFNYVVVPVRSRIMDRNIVYFYNIAFFITSIVAIVIFIFGLKGWADFTPIIAGANMWMNNLDETVINSTSAPIYCDNPDYDYIYDSQWRYDKNSCIDKPVNEIFNKGSGMPGAFWTTTYETATTLKSRQCNATSQICKGHSDKIATQNFFVKHVEKYSLSAQINAEVPYLQYDGRTDNAKLFFEMPNGTVIQIHDTNKLLIKRKISEWLKYFGIESLDTTDIDALYSVKDSKGKCRYRIAGLSLIFSIEVRNTNGPWDYPGDVYVLVKLSVDKNWARVTFKPSPTARLGEARAIDHYGIRWVWKTLPTRVYVFSWEKGFLSVLNVVIFFTIMNRIVHLAVLYCCGKHSKRWRKTVEPVMHYYEEVVQVVKERRVSLIAHHVDLKQFEEIDSDDEALGANIYPNYDGGNEQQQQHKHSDGGDDSKSVYAMKE